MQYSHRKYCKNHSVVACLALVALLSLAGVPSAAQFGHTETVDRYLAAHPQPLSGALREMATNMHRLEVWWISIPEPVSKGGALAAIGEFLLLIHPTGEIFWAHLGRLHGFYSAAIAAPMNFEAIAESNIADKLGADIMTVRVAGAHVEPSGQGARLYLAHHVFDESGCFYFQVSAIDLAFDGEEGLVAGSDWERIFRPEPCMRVGETRHPFAGHQSGGRIVALDETYLLVAYGDHERDGFRSDNAPQNPTVPYGKVWKIARDGSDASIYASGMRNPQGMFVDSEGRVWQSDHGPQGGDELNIIEDGGNYGWPVRTYGVYYNDQTWPLNPHHGNHEDRRFVQPTFVWVPSIAPSNLTQVIGPKFALWTGDLLLATLRDSSLRRLRLDGDRVVYDERIGIGERIRDIVGLDDGRFAMLTDSALVGIVDDPGPKLTYAPWRPPKADGIRNDEIEEVGASLFEVNCATCHRLTQATVEAPPLAGVDGRRIGKFPGFEFSDRLAVSDRRWELASFISFTIDPNREFPGSSMPAVPVSANDAALIYRYLNSAQAADLTANHDADGGVAGIDRANVVGVNFRAPFETAFAVGAPRAVERLELLAPDFRVRYGANSGAAINVTQYPLTSGVDASSGQGHRLAFEVVHQGADTSVTLEHIIGELDSDTFIAEVEARVASNTETSVKWELRIPKLGGGHYRFFLGRARPTSEMSHFAFRTLVDLSVLDAVDQSGENRLNMYLPNSTGAVVELEDYRFSMVPVDEFDDARSHPGFVCLTDC